MRTTRDPNGPLSIGRTTHPFSIDGPLGDHFFPLFHTDMMSSLILIILIEIYPFMFAADR